MTVTLNDELIQKLTWALTAMEADPSAGDDITKRVQNFAQALDQMGLTIGYKAGGNTLPERATAVRVGDNWLLLDGKFRGWLAQDDGTGTGKVRPVQPGAMGNPEVVIGP